MGDPPDVGGGDRCDGDQAAVARAGRLEGGHRHGDRDRRDRPRHLPALDLRATRSHRPPASRSTSSWSATRAVPVPHRDARAVPARVRGGRPHRAPRRPALDLVRPRRGRRVRRDEPVPRRRAAGPGRARRAGVHGVAERPGRPSAPSDGRRRGRSTSARTACGSCRRRTSRTTGRAGCGSTRRPTRCSPATCFTHVGDGPARDDRRASSSLRSAAEAMFHATSFGPDLVPTLRPPRRPRADDARDDARLVVLGRRVGRAPGIRGGVRIGRSGPRRRVDPAPLLATIGDREGSPIVAETGRFQERRACASTTARSSSRGACSTRATGRRSTSSDGSRCRDAATRAQVSTDRRTARTQPKRPSSAR